MQVEVRRSICFVLYSLEVGGTEMYLLQFLKTKGRDFDTTIVCKSGKGGKLENDFKSTGARIIYIKLGYVNVFSIYNYYRILNEGFDAVCDLTGNFAGISMAGSKVKNVPKRIAFYRAATDHFELTLLRKYYNKIMNMLVRGCSTHILSNSETALENYFYDYRGKAQFQVVRNGIGVEKFSQYRDREVLRSKYSLPVEAFIIGHLGRYNKAKNFGGFIKIAERLIELNDRVHFVLCGRDINVVDWSEKFTNNSSLNRFTFLGEQDRPEEILSSYDLFLFPSVTEGQPNALIEAMVSGIPFVASNIPPIKESVPSDLYNQLFDVNNLGVAVKLIMDHLESKIVLKSGYEWARVQYNAKDRFDDFYRVLIG